ncbi:MAG: hypothetical protein HZY79_07165 [Rhodoblastus sp.]|nr:MAG: hypothetical protein HZY79_07165 [Rhodoblastus sp.]
MLNVLGQINAALGSPGAIPVYEPTFGIFGNLLGSIVMVWAILRLRSPEVRFGRYDAACRALYTVWMGYALAQGFSPILIGYILPEIVLCAAQALPVREEAPAQSARA